MSYTVINARFNFGRSVTDLLRARNLEKGGKVQQAIDNSVIAWNMQYVPWKTGTLAKSPYRAYTPGKVVYEGPYARYLYYGEVMGPSIPFSMTIAESLHGSFRRRVCRNTSRAAS